MKVIHSIAVSISVAMLLSACATHNPESEVEIRNSVSSFDDYNQQSSVQPQNSNPNVLAAKMISY